MNPTLIGLITMRADRLTAALKQARLGPEDHNLARNRIATARGLAVADDVELDDLVTADQMLASAEKIIGDAR